VTESGDAIGRDGRRPIEFDDLFRIEWPSQPALSHDGRRLAFVLTTLDEAADAIVSRVVWTALGGGPDGAPRDVGPGRSPLWLLDGRLLYASPNGLRLADVGEGTVDAIPGMPPGGHAAAPTPDGRSIVFVAPDPAPSRAAGPYTVPAKYRIDGVGIVPDHPPSHLWRMDLDGGRLLQLTAGPADDDQPRVSPDGRIASFRSSRGLGPFASVSGIWAVPIDGGEPHEVVDAAGHVRVHAWSPDGRRIAWIGHRRGEVHGINFELWVVDVDDGRPTGAPRQLAADLDRSIGLVIRADAPGPFLPSDLAWTPDGDGLFVIYLEGGTSPLARIDLDGRVTEVAGGRRGVYGFDVARSGTIAIVSGKPDEPGQVAVIEDGAERAVTSLNREWLRGVDLGRSERISFAAPDGQPLEAWLLHPASRPADEPLPLVLQIHGGPHWALGERFAFDPQRLAEGGYRVMLINPRGAQGYGEAYATVNRGDWGGIDARDLLGAVEAAAARPDIDGSRVGVYGESYGGYMTNWLIATTDRFRAAVAQNCISDVASETLSTDEPPGMAYEFLGLPWEQPELYRERSPLTHVTGVRTPLLLIHSEADQNCPINQSEQMFAALVQLGREVEFLRLPGEGHLINLVGRPESRRARADAMDRWFAMHLAQGG
jgi:dipeptidyl aminopeptidase/acylaminoacyl peptidase